jgi:hypothetical protein
MEDDVIKDSDMPETNLLARKRLAMNLNGGHVEKQNSDHALVPMNGISKFASNINKFDEGKEPNLLDTPWKNANEKKLKGAHG